MSWGCQSEGCTEVSMPWLATLYRMALSDLMSQLHNTKAYTYMICYNNVWWSAVTSVVWRGCRSNDSLPGSLWERYEPIDHKAQSTAFPCFATALRVFCGRWLDNMKSCCGNFAHDRKHGSRRMHSQISSLDFINPENLLKQRKELLLGTLRSCDFRLRQDGSIT